MSEKKCFMGKSIWWKSQWMDYFMKMENKQKPNNKYIQWNLNQKLKMWKMKQLFRKWDNKGICVFSVSLTACCRVTKEDKAFKSGFTLSFTAIISGCSKGTCSLFSWVRCNIGVIVVNEAKREWSVSYSQVTHALSFKPWSPVLNTLSNTDK